MEEKMARFESLLQQLEKNDLSFAITGFDVKPANGKWSKKEIMGHLIDSAINNIQRVSEIQYAQKPYKIRPYNQDELVKANDYQNKNAFQLHVLLLSLNRHLLHLAKIQTRESLLFSIILPNGQKSDLQFLITDYFDHFHHHIHQINPEWT